MIVLLGAALLVLGAGAAPVLSRSAWCQRMPRVAVLAWSGVLAGTLAAAVGLVVVVSTGPSGLGHRVVEWAANCLHHHERGGPVAYGLNLALIAGVLVTAAVTVLRYRRTVGQRRRHREALEFVVRTSSELADVCVLDHPLPVVYCVPARRHPIVVSSGALDRLDETQLQAVLAHERVHLRHRHHLLLAAVDALSWLPAFHLARRSLPVLLEMSADDIAAHNWGRTTVATALRTLTVAPSPTGGLAAGGSTPSDLTRRLIRLAAPAPSQAPLLTWTAATASAAVPTLISAAWIAALPLFC